MNHCSWKWTTFMIIISTMGISRSDLVIKANYSAILKINITIRNIYRFTDCVCNTSAINCTFKLNDGSNSQRTLLSVVTSLSTEQNGQTQFKNIYTCEVANSSIIICLRNTLTANYNGEPLMYIDDSFNCDLHCVGIHWKKSQNASIEIISENIIKEGDLSAHCLSTTITTGTTSNKTTTIRTTTDLTTTTTKTTTKLTTTLSTTQITLTNVLNTSTESPINTVSVNVSGSTSSLAVSSNDLNNTTGIIVGTVVGIVVMLAVGVGTVIFIRRRRKGFRRTASNKNVYVNGNLNKCIPGANVSGYSELDLVSSGHDNETQYQYSEINTQLNYEKEEYLNGKCFSQKDKGNFSKSNIFPTVTRDSGAVQSNGVYRLASISDSGDASKNEYSSSNEPTEKLKATTIYKHTLPHTSEDQIYSNQKKSAHDEVDVNLESPTMNYLLANSTHDKGSQNAKVIDDVDLTTNLQAHTYATLRDQEKNIIHTYNCLSDSTKPSTVTIKEKHLPINETADNQSPNYCVASSFSFADDLSQPDPNIAGNDVITVSSEYDLARV